MKNFIFVLVLALIGITGFDASAQTVPTHKTRKLIFTSTVTNTSAATQKTGIVDAYYRAAAIDVLVTRTSGTMGGMIRLFGSMDDGVTFVKFDSLTVTNSTPTQKQFILTTYPYTNLQVSYTNTTATQVSVLRTRIVLKD